MKRLPSLTMLLLLFGTTTSADVILGTDHPTAAPLLMDPGTTSDALHVNVANTASPDLLAGWQVELRIIPHPGATGTLSFNPDSTGEPDDNYVFAGITTVGGPTFPAVDQLIDFEATFPFTTVSVPSTPGANLLKTAFDASDDAFGSFGIFAVPGFAHSEWTDETINAREYTNLPSMGGNVEVGRVLVVSESIAFDFNDDQSVDIVDLDALVGQIVAQTNDATFDLSGDGAVNHADLTAWLSGAANHNGFAQAYLSGDSDLDGFVGSLDLNNLAINWQQEVATWSGGDFTADGIANSIDLNELGIRWQQSIPTASSVAAPVPEPSVLLLTVLGATLIWRRPRCG